MPLYLIRAPTDESSTPTLSASLVDAAGLPVAANQLDALWLTLYDSHSLVIINGRVHVDALSAPGMSVDNTGLFVWVLSPEDMEILDDQRRIETHVVLLEAQWMADGVARQAELIIAINVRNLVLSEDLLEVIP